VDLLSTTINSAAHPAGIVTLPKAARVCCKLSARLQVQMITETSDFGVILEILTALKLSDSALN
jgi:hypothetical protein